MAWWNPFSRRRTDAPQLPAPAASTPEEPKMLPAGPGPSAQGWRHDSQARVDGIVNILMGHGSARDKRMFSSFEADVVSDTQALELWRGNDLAKKVIEAKVSDAMRKGYELKVGDDKDLAKEIVDSGRKLGFNAMAAMGRMYERAYGGGALFPVANDGRDLSEPLNEDAITSIDAVQLFEPRELWPSRWQNDLSKPKFGKPSAYRMFPIFGNGAPAMQRQTEIHESRLIIFYGTQISRRQTNGTLPGWGDSELTLVNRKLAEWDLSFSSANALVNDFAQAVMSMEGLAETMDEGGEAEVKARLALIDLMRSTMRLVPIDSKDKLERIATPISGLADLLNIGMLVLSSAFDMPVTRLWGRAPAGMNATGESDTAMWDDQVQWEQSNDLQPPLERLYTLLMKSRKGPTAGKVPKGWGMKWHPLRQPTELESAQARKAQADADCEYIDRGVYSPEEIAHNRSGGDGYSFETVVDWKARAAETMVVDPIVKPEPEVPEPVPGDPNAPAAGEQPVDEVAAARARATAEARRAADSLPDGLRYDALDVAYAKQSGVMIAVYVPGAIAQEIAMDGGEAVGDLHVTLAYLGSDLPDVAVQRAVGVAFDCASCTPPPRARLAGAGKFNASESSGGKDVIYAGVDSAELCDIQRRLLSHLDCLNVPASREHGFLPHITLAYVEPGKGKLPAIESYELEFAAIVVAAGAERIILPFNGVRREGERGAQIMAAPSY